MGKAIVPPRGLYSKHKEFETGDFAFRQKQGFRIADALFVPKDGSAWVAITILPIMGIFIILRCHRSPVCDV